MVLFPQVKFMKIYILLLISLFLVSCNKNKATSSPELQALYSELDQEIDNSEQYEQVKNNRIAELRKNYYYSNDENRKTAIINCLIREYEAFNADSALFYISLNLRRPAIFSIPGEHTRQTIKRADILAHAGLFSDALATLENIPRNSIDSTLIEMYYSTYCATYQYLSEYTNEHETALNNEQLRAAYADSIRQVTSPSSFSHMVYVMAEKARNGDYKTAIAELSSHLKEYQFGTREYAILASTLAYIYKTAGISDEYKRHIVLSAISDVKGAVKENVSFREVATFMFEDGEIERANKYLKKSIADANSFSALMRNVQSSKMLPVIDEAYTSFLGQLNNRLRNMVGISSALSIVLVITIVLILKQFKNIHKANTEIRNANKELSLLSEQLKQANIELEDKNNELKNFSNRKEKYAGLFMEYSSSAILTLQHYQKSLRVLVAQGGNKAALTKKLESTEVADQLLKNFYVKFDEAILNMYPSFVDKFNALLKPEDRIILKSGELLNTELRLYALVRMGIDDSAKIADFLRCSISTVYTYRSKIKKRAINPDTFENDVKNLG